MSLDEIERMLKEHEEQLEDIKNILQIMTDKFALLGLARSK